MSILFFAWFVGYNQYCHSQFLALFNSDITIFCQVMKNRFATLATPIHGRLMSIFSTAFENGSVDWLALLPARMALEISNDIRLKFRFKECRPANTFYTA